MVLHPTAVLAAAAPSALIRTHAGPTLPPLPSLFLYLCPAGPGARARQPAAGRLGWAGRAQSPHVPGVVNVRHLLHLNPNISLRNLSYWNILWLVCLWISSTISSSLPSTLNRSSVILAFDAEVSTYSKRLIWRIVLSWPAWGSSNHGHGLPTWAVGMDMCFLRKIMTLHFSKPSFGNSDGLKIDFQSVKYNKPVEYALCSRKVHDDINFGFFPANHFWPLGWP